MGLVIALPIAFAALIPSMLIGEWLDKKVSTEVGGLFKLCGSLLITGIICHLIGIDTLNAINSIN